MGQPNVLINGSGLVCLTDDGLVPEREYRNHWGFISPLDALEVANYFLALSTVDNTADIFAAPMLVIVVFTGKKPFLHAKSDALDLLWIMDGKRLTRPTNDQGFDISERIWDVIQLTLLGTEL